MVRTKTEQFKWEQEEEEEEVAGEMGTNLKPTPGRAAPPFTLTYLGREGVVAWDREPLAFPFPTKNNLAIHLAPPRGGGAH